MSFQPHPDPHWDFSISETQFGGASDENTLLCVWVCILQVFTTFMDLWPPLSRPNLTITESLPAICHWIQVINLLSGAMIRSFHSKLTARASGGQLFNGLLSLQLVSWPGSWGQEETSKAVSNKRGIGKRLHRGKSSFGSSDWGLDLLRHRRWNGNILKQ